jgi:glucose-1-phosphate thymidylyltransferase|tara:strand:+ start:210 stop:869 length:660 start_codon:yes stop_codon:yes gene_type:complete
MIEISGVPILLWQLNWLKQNRITEVVILAGYLQEKIIDYTGNGSRFGMKIEFVFEETPLGTGGALKNAKKILENDKNFIMLNGDILTKLDLQKLCNRVNGNIKAALAVVPLPSSFGVIDIAKDDTILGFREKPLLDGYWMNAGAYCLSTSILDHLPNKGNIETTAFPELATNGTIKAVRYSDDFWISIDSHKDIENATINLEDDLKAIKKNYSIKRFKP